MSIKADKKSSSGDGYKKEKKFRNPINGFVIVLFINRL